MNKLPLISICIPAYNRTDGLKRLLLSIQEQSFKNYEIIITDDSSNHQVYDLITGYFAHLPIRYFKNEKALGTPENWNEGVRKATGEWIKIMHDDDWFSNVNSLKIFADSISSTNALFLFSYYTDVVPEVGKKTVVQGSSFWLERIAKEPAILWAKNYIGPPSVTLYHKSIAYSYDAQMKWLVDIDFYRRVIKDYGFKLIPENLICVGVGSTQVTQYVKYELPLQAQEHLLYLNKLDNNELNNFWVFDYNWRFIRNFNIKNTEDLKLYNNIGDTPLFLQQIIKVQKRMPALLLKWGITSKLLMSICYVCFKPIKK